MKRQRVDCSQGETSRLLQRGRPAGNIGSAQIKNGAHSAVPQSGLHPLRRNSDKDDVRGGQHRHHTAKRLKDRDLISRDKVALLVVTKTHSSSRSSSSSGVATRCIRMCCANSANLSLAKYCKNISTCGEGLCLGQPDAKPTMQRPDLASTRCSA